MNADERDMHFDAMAMQRQRFTTGRRVGHKSRYYNGDKELSNGRSVKFYAWIDIIECTNIEALGLMAPILKAVSSVDVGKLTYTSFLLPVTHL